MSKGWCMVFTMTQHHKMWGSVLAKPQDVGDPTTNVLSEWGLRPREKKMKQKKGLPPIIHKTLNDAHSLQGIQRD